MTRTALTLIALVTGTLTTNTWAGDGHVGRSPCDELCRFLEKDSSAQAPAAPPVDHSASPVASPKSRPPLPRMPRPRVLVARRHFDSRTVTPRTKDIEDLNNPLFATRPDLNRSVGPVTVARFRLLVVAAENSTPAVSGLLVTEPVLPPAAVPPGVLAPAVRHVATVALAKNTAPAEAIEGSAAAVIDTPLVPSRGNEVDPLPIAMTLPPPPPAKDRGLLAPPPFDVIAALLLAGAPPRRHASLATAY